jgi:hypothetical protein
MMVTKGHVSQRLSDVENAADFVDSKALFIV